MKRRIIEGRQKGENRLPLEAAHRAAASPTDLAALLAGEVDLDRAVLLARALMALDSKKWAKSFLSLRTPPTRIQPDEGWIAIRLAMLPWALPDGSEIGLDPAILRRLESGDSTYAVEIAVRRLGAAGIRSTLRAAIVPPDTARRWAAAIAFPITKRTATEFVNLLDPNS